MSIIILQLSQNNQQSYTGLGILEFFKDIPNAIVSIFLVDYIKKYSYNKALAYALILSAICSFSIPFLNEFWFLKVWFILIGMSFSIGKICVFSIIKNIARNEKEFSSIMTRTESSFMFGVFLVNMEFALILNSEYKDFWKFGFWLVGIIAIIGSAILFKSKFELKSNSEEPQEEVPTNWKSLLRPQFLLFYGLIFFIVFAEQIFNSWLPTFYKNNLNTDSFFALQSSAFLALFSFGGRLLASKVTEKIPPMKYFYTCLLTSVVLLLIAHFLGYHTKENTSILVLLFPLVGIFLAPLYPLLNSKFLSHYSEKVIGRIVSAIILATSLGGSIGSISTSYLFQKNLGNYYLLFATIPLILILIFSSFLSLKKN
jgi:predicted MFS family arabinose efflux permease